MADKTGDKGQKMLREAVVAASRGYSDRWPARGKTSSASGDYRPLDEVYREGQPVKYRKYPSGTPG